MTDSDRPDLRPVVVNSNTGMSAAVHPSLPPLNLSRPLCTPFIAFRNPSLGMDRGYGRVGFPAVPGRRATH